MAALLKIVGWSTAGLLALLAAWSIPIQDEHRYTCVVCRLGRVDTTLLGFARSRYGATGCSRWYAEHVEPSHLHAWDRTACSVKRNLFGRWVALTNWRLRSPIVLLDPDAQTRAYQHFKDPLEAKRLFEGLVDDRTRIEELDADRGHLVIAALKEWDARGFPGTWEEWWKDFRARRLQEREEFASWKHSGSGLSFHDWRDRRKTGAD